MTDTSISDELEKRLEAGQPPRVVAEAAIQRVRILENWKSIAKAEAAEVELLAGENRGLRGEVEKLESIIKQNRGVTEDIHSTMISNLEAENQLHDQAEEAFQLVKGERDQLEEALRVANEYIVKLRQYAYAPHDKKPGNEEMNRAASKHTSIMGELGFESLD